MDIRAFLDHWFTRIGLGGAIGFAVAIALNVFVIGGMYVARKRR